ncbi:hypothetical protein MIMGU_mgv1a023415mg, partial [Erythranthe guttata]
LRIWVKRGINLVVGNDGHIGDPYVVITSSKQSVKTRVVTKDINPEWDEKLGIRVANHSHSISLTVHDRTKFKFDDKLGEANLDIRPFVEAVKLNPNGLPNGSISARVLPSISNCLNEESSVFWENGTVKQDMCQRLKNVESGEIELQLEWINKFKPRRARNTTQAVD